MNMNGEIIIEADPKVVWVALTSPDVLKDCVDGCTELVGSIEEGLAATVVQKVGPVKATFKGQVAVSEMDEPRRLTISGSGKGGAAGFAKGEAAVELVPVSTGTNLVYAVEARVGGKLAQIGSRIINSFAKRMADRFFETLARKLNS